MGRVAGNKRDRWIDGWIDKPIYVATTQH